MEISMSNHYYDYVIFCNNCGHKTPLTIELFNEILRTLPIERREILCGFNMVPGFDRVDVLSKLKCKECGKKDSRFETEPTKTRVGRLVAGLPVEDSGSSLEFVPRERKIRVNVETCGACGGNPCRCGGYL